MDIASRLDKAMNAAGYKSQSALARASGVPQATINRILQNVAKGDPDTATLRKLAGACRVSFGWLADGDNGGASSPALLSSYITLEEAEIITAFRELDEPGRKLIKSTAETGNRVKTTDHLIIGNGNKP